LVQPALPKINKAVCRLTHIPMPVHMPVHMPVRMPG
jgi:hypothetical protein